MYVVLVCSDNDVAVEFDCFCAHGRRRFQCEIIQVPEDCFDGIWIIVE